MSQESFERFVNAVKSDAALKTKLQEARDPETFVALAVEAGRERGLVVTPEELRSCIGAGRGKAGELSDSQLDTVAGGSFSWSWGERAMLACLDAAVAKGQSKL